MMHIPRPRTAVKIISIIPILLFHLTTQARSQSLPASADSYGFIDKSGHFVIAPQFDGVISGFHDGLSAVRLYDGGQQGYIDKTGAVVIRSRSVGAYEFSEGLAKVVFPNGESGAYIDKTGKVVFSVSDHAHSRLSGFSEGLASVRGTGEKYGYINTSGLVTIPYEFDGATSFSEGLAAVNKGGKWGYIDKTGALAIPYQFDGYSGVFSEGLASVRKGDKQGYVDKKGAFAIPPQFDSADTFSEGRAAVKQDGRSFYIDHTGAAVIKIPLNNLAHFRDGIAAVSEPDDRTIRRESWYRWYIDRSGALLFGPEFPSPKIASDDKPFSEGLLAVVGPNRRAYLDRSGKTVISLPNALWIDNFHEGLAAVQVEWKAFPVLAAEARTETATDAVKKALTGRWRTVTAVNPAGLPRLVEECVMREDSGEVSGVCESLSGKSQVKGSLKGNAVSFRHSVRNGQFDLDMEWSGVLASGSVILGSVVIKDLNTVGTFSAQRLQ